MSNHSYDHLNTSKSRMCFPHAGDYLSRSTYTLGDSRIGDQPACLDPFHFGLHPKGLAGIDIDVDGAGPRKIAVIGAGHAYKTFIRAALVHRGTQIYIVDIRDELPFTLTSREHRVDSLDQLPPDISCVTVSTPPGFHGDYLRHGLEHGIPVMMEKPIVPKGAFLRETGGATGRLQESGTSPVYAMDWEVLLATPLMLALGKPAPFKDIVKGENFEAFSRFRLDHVVNLETTFVEGGTNPLGDNAKKQNRGGWLFDISGGGGALYDMGVHALNTISVLGFIPHSVERAYLGEPNYGGQKGVYRLIGSDSIEEDPNHIGHHRPIAEMYARAHLQVRYKGRHIPTLLECGKGGVENDMRISMTDDKGHVLNWEYGFCTSVVTLVDSNQKVLARAYSEVDPYSLMFEHALCFFKDEKILSQTPGYKPTALYWREHEDVLHFLDLVQIAGRAQRSSSGRAVKQLKLTHSFVGTSEHSALFS